MLKEKEAEVFFLLTYTWKRGMHFREKKKRGGKKKKKERKPKLTICNKVICDKDCFAIWILVL